MIYRVFALLCMAIFYGTYFAKQILQKKHGIHTNQMARGTVKDKSYYTELILQKTAFILPVVEVISIVFVSSNLIQKIFGLYFCVLGVALFAAAVFSMRDSWRAGIAEQDKECRELVTSGIYRYSRNPAFLGFDLLYLGILIMFFHPVLLVFTAFAIIMMHLQILNEEKYLEKTYGEAYLAYKHSTSRYAGLGKLSFDKLLLYGYVCLFLWSLLYFVTCLSYVGPGLSMLWIWPMAALFSGIRIWMLLRQIAGKLDVPRGLRIGYQAVFALGLCIFVFIEANITMQMHAEPVNNLDYVIVLGAGLRGRAPSNPLRVRIECAYEYMTENSDTVLIASGGQGPDEEISEAQCIQEWLVEMGISADRILLEDQSTSTEENLRNSLRMIGNADASVGIITNGFHEYRAALLAKDVGFTNVVSVPAITLFPVGIHYTVREFFGVIHYLITG